jgi:hypothetical protein
VEKRAEGYLHLAAFLDSDESFKMNRQFSFIHARILLQKQDELSVMKQELDEMDQRDDSDEDAQVSQCEEEGEARTDLRPDTRQSLLNRIKEKLLKYGKSIWYSVFGRFH